MHSAQRIITVIALVICAYTTCWAVQLNDWRSPLWQKMALLDDSLVSSPSGMFWDNIVPDAPSRPDLWPPLPTVNGFWEVEPALAFGMEAERSNALKSWYHGDLRNDVRLHHFFMRQVLNVDSRFFGDPAFIWKKDRFAAGRIEEAYVQVDGSLGFFRIGRLKRNWGPFSDRSLVLSDNSHTVDGVEWQIHAPIFEFRQIFSIIPYSTTPLDIDTITSTHRFFSAHSLNFMFGSWATVGITEAILFCRPSGTIDLQYINPVGIYTVSNTNGEGDGNLMLILQASGHPFTKRIQLQGQIIFDDFQIDNKTPSDQEPFDWGLDIGASIRNPLPVSLQSVLTLDYHYLSRWLYTVSDANVLRGERYTVMGQGLGYPNNDGDRISVALSLFGDCYWLATLGLSYQRQGAGKIQTRWHDTDSGATPGSLGYRKEPTFPSPTVCYTSTLFGEANIWWRKIFSSAIRIENRWIINRNNIAYNKLEYDPLLMLSISAHIGNARLTLAK